MSTHEVAIVEIGDVEKHPNADTLGLTKLWGWQCCVRTADFKSGDRAVYVPPDYMVPLDRSEFAFLKRDGETKTHERIRVRRFRGQLSQGLLIGVPDELQSLPTGANVIESLGITRYEPPQPTVFGAEFVSGPSGIYSPKFDVESWQRYSHVFTDGESVIITEKLHGASARFTYATDATGENAQFVGSRTNWHKDNPANPWWRAFRACPAIGAWCQANPGRVLYGEIFGQVQSLKYGAGRNDIWFAAFAILDMQTWMNTTEAMMSADDHGVPWVPTLYAGPLDKALVSQWASGNTRMPNANHIREGCVIAPAVERISDEIGRVCLKLVSDEYLEKH